MKNSVVYLDVLFLLTVTISSLHGFTLVGDSTIDQPKENETNVLILNSPHEESVPAKGDEDVSNLISTLGGSTVTEDGPKENDSGNVIGAPRQEDQTAPDEAEREEKSIGDGKENVDVELKEPDNETLDQEKEEETEEAEREKREEEEEEVEEKILEEEERELENRLKQEERELEERLMEEERELEEREKELDERLKQEENELEERLKEEERELEQREKELEDKLELEENGLEFEGKKLEERLEEEKNEVHDIEENAKGLEKEADEVEKQLEEEKKQAEELRDQEEKRLEELKVEAMELEMEKEERRLEEEEQKRELKEEEEERKLEEESESKPSSTEEGNTGTLTNDEDSLEDVAENEGVQSTIPTETSNVAVEEGSENVVSAEKEGVGNEALRQEEEGDVNKEEEGGMNKEEEGDVNNEEEDDVNKEEEGDMNKEKEGDVNKEEEPESANDGDASSTHDESKESSSLPTDNNPTSTSEGQEDSGNEPGQTSIPTDSSESTASPNFQRTLILIEKTTEPGQNVFLRGGIDHDQRKGCDDSEDLSNNPCAIPIRSRPLGVIGSTTARNAWSEHDSYLDWHGAEKDQGSFNGKMASGTPAQWTTNQPDSDYFEATNTYGPNYWLVDIDMDCSKTVDGFFEFKGFLDDQWEQSSEVLGVKCDGDDALAPPFSANNHFGRCGYINVYHWGDKKCQINGFNQS